MASQITSRVIMVRPAAFGYNMETAANNTFQHRPGSSDEQISEKAKAEFDQMVETLRANGVEVMVIEDSVQPVKPDAVFPNNWISFHENDIVVTYPMFSPLRRQERREEIIQQIGTQFRINQMLRFEDFEGQHIFLEGTGSMVLDRENRIAYACISPRTDAALLEKWCLKMGYTPFSFPAIFDGQEIYHTNVMMAIGMGVAIVCLEVVPSPYKESLLAHLAAHGREVVQLRADQVTSFAGNMLALRNKDGEQLMVMSKAADESLDLEQRAQINRHARIVSFDVHTIETIGGGSVRCMIAENFLESI